MSGTDLERYTRTDLENARTKGQLIGWVQGGGIVLVGGLLLKFVGWIPTLAVIGVGGFLLYKLLAPKRD
jgi:hypothetical protein